MKNWSILLSIFLYTTLAAISQTPPVWQDYVDAYTNGTQAILPEP